MAQERLHVVPHEDGWAVKAENTSGPESTHSTQREAIDTARELCRKKESDLVIHRLDGTIRNVYAYGDTNNNADYEEETNMANGRTERRERLDINDVASVGSRISWGAILAGAFVALSLMVALGVLLTALGLTARDSVSDRTLFYGSLIASLIVTLGSLFIGGYVASCATAGETKSESIMYGIILWGTVFAIVTGLSAAGANLGYNAAMRVSNDQQQATLPSKERMEALGFDPAQVQRLQEEISTGARQTDASSVAWWTFAGILLSMAAAVGGSIVGSGPILLLRRTVATTTTPTGARVTTSA